MQLTYKDFYFCYNKKMSTYLTDVKGIPCITVAKSPTTDKPFSLFHKDNQGNLQQAIDEYKQVVSIINN